MANKQITYSFVSSKFDRENNTSYTTIKTDLGEITGEYFPGSEIRGCKFAEYMAVVKYCDLKIEALTEELNGPKLFKTKNYYRNAKKFIETLKHDKDGLLKRIEIENEFAKDLVAEIEKRKQEGYKRFDINTSLEVLKQAMQSQK